MDRVKVLLASLIVLAVVSAGCVGGGEKAAPKAPQMVENNGTTGTDGEKVIDGGIEDAPVTEKVSLTIPAVNVTKISMVITVNDGNSKSSDENTNPDDVTGNVEGGGGGANVTKTLPGGSTPYKTTVDISAPEGETLPSSWTITLNVVCKPSDDQWPGPLIWRGYTDHGFSYSINVTYTYLTPG
ncbi:MAG: hypothetical protein J7L61_01595 [Thermoplasmata archaeon]|nr:hypothetical protein [Thermoplasmata archaeon]